MVEQRPKPESEADRLKTAFNSFRDLAKKYGQKSEEGGLTFKKYIDNNEGLHDVLSGRDYGINSRTLEIFYGVGHQGHKVILSQDHLGSISFNQVLVFKRRDKTNFWEPKPDENINPDITLLNVFIKRVETISKDEKRNLQIRKKLAQGLGSDFRMQLDRKKELERQREIDRDQEETRRRQEERKKGTK